MKTLLLLATATFVLTGVNARPNCDNLEKETVAEVVESCTTSIKSTKNYRLVVDASVDPVKWDTFTKSLQTIDGVNVIIEYSFIFNLIFPALTKISSPNGDFIIRNNQELTEVSIVVKEEMSQQNFKIEMNPKLTKLTLAIPSVKIGKDFVIAGNSAMTEIVSSSIKTLNAGNLLVMNNKALGRFELGVLKVIEISRDVNITKNANLDVITIGMKGLSMTKVPRLTVMQNTKLYMIQGAFKNIQLKIRGNPTIQNDLLLHLKKPTDEIQPEGECMFDEKISNLDDLHICKIVGSDLELADNIQGNSAGINIAEITGKINLGNAKPDQVNFLQNTKTIGGSITSSNCTFPAELYGHSVVIQPPSPCTKATPRVKTMTTMTTEEKPTAGPSASGRGNSGDQSPSQGARASASDSNMTWNKLTFIVVCCFFVLAVIVVCLAFYYICCHDKEDRQRNLAKIKFWNKKENRGKKGNKTEKKKGNRTTSTDSLSGSGSKDGQTPVRGKKSTEAPSAEPQQKKSQQKKSQQQKSNQQTVT